MPGSSGVTVMGEYKPTMEEALLRLNEWDMLHLTPDGRGHATGDAPWARDMIGRALGYGGTADTRVTHERLNLLHMNSIRETTDAEGSVK
jgi:hypothetical protein